MLDNLPFGAPAPARKPGADTMSLDNLRLSVKSLIPLVMMACTVLAMVALGANRLSSVSATAREVIQEHDVAVVALARASRRLVYLTYDVLAAVVYDPESPEGEASDKNYNTVVAEVAENLDFAARLVPERAQAIAEFKSRVLKLYDDSKEAYKAAGVVHNHDLKLDERDLTAKAGQLAAQVDIGAGKLLNDLKDFDDALLKANADSADQLLEEARSAVWTLSIVGVLATLVVGACSYLLTNAKISRPLNRMVERMKSLAGGDLRVEIDAQDRRDEVGEIAREVQVFKTNAVERGRAEREADEHRANAEAERERAQAERASAAEEQAAAMQALGAGLKRLSEGDLTARLDQGFSARYAQIKDDFNAAVEKLLLTVRTVVASTSAIQTGSLEISTASDDLSHRTEQQAASLEETAAALNEITETLKRSAEGVKHASQLIANADGDAKKGAVVVKQAVDAMGAISKSSQQIGQIIGVIDEIAFQTNLLALNAGVEAARAGDAGKGFAVVASEVRGLAQRSADAAKEIKSLISTSTAQVTGGVKLVADTGSALERIIAQVAEINQVVADLASGAVEQASGIEQVNAALNQMEQSTQRNATMVEESTAASHSLKQETSQLATLVDQFKVGANANAAMRAELQKTAPHAFAKPAAPPPRAPAKAAPAPVRRAKVASGGAAAANNDWNEF